MRFQRKSLALGVNDKSELVIYVTRMINLTNCDYIVT